MASRTFEVAKNRKHYSGGIYLFKVNSGNMRTMCEICLKLSIKTPEQRCGAKVMICNVLTFLWCSTFCFCTGQGNEKLDKCRYA